VASRAVRGEQSRSCAGALDQRVGHQGRAVHDAGHLGGVEVVLLHGLPQQRLDTCRRLGMGSQSLTDRYDPLVIDDAEVGEGATDVDTHT
jgi:hypothetical protein